MIDHQLLQDIEFFELHDEDDRKSLAKVLDHMRLKAGARLFERGDRGSEPYIYRVEPRRRIHEKGSWK